MHREWIFRGVSPLERDFFFFYHGKRNVGVSNRVYTKGERNKTLGLSSEEQKARFYLTTDIPA